MQDLQTPSPSPLVFLAASPAIAKRGGTRNGGLCLIRTLLIVPLLLLLLCSSASAHTWPAHCRDARAPLLCKIHRNVNRTNQLRRRMGERPIPYRWVAEAHPARRPRLLAYWIMVRRDTMRRWTLYQQAPWLHGAWHQAALCLHRYEGSWTDPGAPYWGGLQMDLSFQSAYGKEWLREYGTADHWPPADQLHAAYRAWRTRGWTPWPNTARACDLL